MRSNQPVADILLWDCDDHPEKKGGKGLYRQGQGMITWRRRVVRGCIDKDKV
jgi:hypothetical protein